ncbi:MAG: OmpH family outer membrane protein [Prevotella sp.]|nr:OmpH family outer membrane protein [Prevotella sp.]
MKRLASNILFMCVFLGISAQENNTFRFGYLSYETAIQSMPEYALVQQKMKALQEQFQAETLRVEDEFNRKYEDFLDGQRDFPRTILQKRQSELQELMEKNIQFKEQGRQELADAEREAMAPLRIRLIELLSTIGREKGFAFIYDTDTKALPFLNISFGEDINQLVQDALK